MKRKTRGFQSPLRSRVVFTTSRSIAFISSLSPLAREVPPPIGNFRRIESDDILQRRNDLAFARKANDREPNSFECKWISFEFFDDCSHTVLHVFYGVAYHRFGDIEEEINGESAHISEK